MSGEEFGKKSKCEKGRVNADVYEYTNHGI